MEDMSPSNNLVALFIVSQDYVFRVRANKFFCRALLINIFNIARMSY